MKLKSSNKASSFFIIAIGIIALLLLFWSKNTKESKYVSAPEFEQKTSLDVIQISLKERHYNKLKKKRDKALSVGILETSDSDYVPAMITYNGTEFKADIRLKGDWTDHLKGDKWSFRIKLKDDKTILGMRKFSIHHPKTRGYINEWLYHKAVKNEELIGLRYGFLEGAIHIKRENSSELINREVGIYAIEETFDKRTLESNKRKESVILKYSEDLWWNGVKKSLAISEPSGLHWFNFNKSVKYPITLFSESNVLQDSTMFTYFKLGKNLLKNAGGRIAISDAFDIKKLAMQNAVMNLFGATHGNSIINLRFYYNPIISKLEPIAFDGNSGLKLKKYEHFNFGRKEKEDSLYTKELIHALGKVSRPDYLEKLYNSYKSEISEYEKTLKSEFSVATFSLANLKYNQEVIKEELKKLQLEQGGIIVETQNVENAVTKEILKLPELKNWISNNGSITKTSLSYIGNPAYSIIRESTLKSSYNVVNNIDATIGSTYKLSVIAKKGENSNFIGLRILGTYPNRVDAIFDLNTGKVKGKGNEGNFTNESAEIIALGNGWYNCSLSGRVFSEKIKVLFGPTNGQMRARSWESKINDKSDVLIIPSSLEVKELLNSPF